MKILVLGGNGMLGHNFLKSWENTHIVKVTLRNSYESYQPCSLFNHENSYFGVDVCLRNNLEGIVDDFLPDAIVNAIGITKQLSDRFNPAISIEINSLFPHLLADICKKHGVRLINLSTDCIFSGEKGFYSELDVSDARDLYGRSKYLGETSQKNTVTLRKSTIGLEYSGYHGLIEWFLNQSGTVKGYRKAIYSGLITNELANVIEMILIYYPDLSGIWHVASKPISKYDLLIRLNQRLGRQDIEVIPDSTFICERSLNGHAFEKATGYVAPSWDDMLNKLADEIKLREK